MRYLIQAAVLAAFACQAIPVLAGGTEEAAPAEAPAVATPTAPAPVPAPVVIGEGTKVTANIGFVSDYLFRGVSQTAHHPAIQGGFDWAPDTGLYLGTWASNVSGSEYHNGSMEWDFYGGYAHKVNDDLAWSAGLLEYYYPGASTPAGGQKYNNLEANAQVTWKGFQLKDSIALTDYFGLNTASGGATLPNGTVLLNGSSRGTHYLEANYTRDLPGKFATLGLHVGHAFVRNYSPLSYTDYKVGLTREIRGFTWGIAVGGTNAERGTYVDANGKELADARLVLSVLKTF